MAAELNGWETALCIIILEPLLEDDTNIYGNATIGVSAVSGSASANIGFGQLSDA